jgi:hypothetical protein
MLDLAEGCLPVLDGDELHVLGVEERVAGRIQALARLEHADRELVLFAAEDEGEGEDQDKRQHDVPRERAPVAQELAIAGAEDG